MTADGLPAIGNTRIDVEGMNNPTNAQALLDFDNLPDIYPQFKDQWVGGNEHGAGSYVAPYSGYVTTELVDPQTGRVVSRAEAGQQGDNYSYKDTPPAWHPVAPGQ